MPRFRTFVSHLVLVLCAVLHVASATGVVFANQPDGSEGGTEGEQEDAREGGGSEGETENNSESQEDGKGAAPPKTTPLRRPGYFGNPYPFGILTHTP